MQLYTLQRGRNHFNHGKMYKVSGYSTAKTFGDPPRTDKRCYRDLQSITVFVGRGYLWRRLYLAGAYSW